MGLIAIPWTIVGGALVVYNFYFNLNVNNNWAEGNIWLTANTLYLCYQFVNSLLLAYEYPLFLKVYRVERFLSFVLASVYTLLFVTSAVEWAKELWLTANHSDYDFISIYFNMALAYNILVHWCIIPVNLFIIVKELTMLGYTFLTGDDYALTLNDVEETNADLKWFFNPFTWIDMFWDAFFGNDVEDYWEENPRDEQHYYKNW